MRMTATRELADLLRTAPEVTPAMILQAAAVIAALCDAIESHRPADTVVSLEKQPPVPYRVRGERMK